MKENISLKHTLNEYSKKYRNRKYRLLKFTKKEVESFDIKNNTKGANYLLKGRKWWLIGDTYYEVPKAPRFTWFRNLNAGIQIGTCLLGAGAIAAAVAVPLVLMNQKENYDISVDESDKVDYVNKGYDKEGNIICNIKAKTGYKIESLTLSIGNYVLEENKDYTYDRNSGDVVIKKEVAESHPGKLNIKPNFKSKEKEYLISLDKTSHTFKVGEDFNLKATITEKNEDPTLTWEVTGETKDAVTLTKVSNTEYKVTASKVGSCKVAVTCTNGNTAECSITVSEETNKEKFVRIANDWVTGPNGFINSDKEYLHDDIEEVVLDGNILNNYRIEYSSDLGEKNSRELFVIDGIYWTRVASERFSGDSLSDDLFESSETVTYEFNDNYIKYTNKNPTTSQIKTITINKYGYVTDYYEIGEYMDNSFSIKFKDVAPRPVVYIYDEEPIEKTIKLEKDITYKLILDNTANTFYITQSGTKQSISEIVDCCAVISGRTDHRGNITIVDDECIDFTTISEVYFEFKCKKDIENATLNLKYDETKAKSAFVDANDISYSLDFEDIKITYNDEISTTSSNIELKFESENSKDVKIHLGIYDDSEEDPIQEIENDIVIKANDTTTATITVNDDCWNAFDDGATMYLKADIVYKKANIDYSTLKSALPTGVSIVEGEEGSSTKIDKNNSLIRIMYKNTNSEKKSIHLILKNNGNMIFDYGIVTFYPTADETYLNTLDFMEWDSIDDGGSLVFDVSNEETDKVKFMNESQKFYNNFVEKQKTKKYTIDDITINSFYCGEHFTKERCTFELSYDEYEGEPYSILYAEDEEENNITVCLDCSNDLWSNYPSYLKSTSQGATYIFNDDYIEYTYNGEVSEDEAAFKHLKYNKNGYFEEYELYCYDSIFSFSITYPEE